MADIQLNDRQRWLASKIDHTVLKPQATHSDIVQACREARRYGFYSVCVQPNYVEAAVGELEGANALVCTVIGFPFGATFTAVKCREAELALESGAAELDMVLDIGRLLDGRTNDVARDIEAVAALAHERGAALKVIIETALLERSHKLEACTIAAASGADFIKTSTGFSTAGATLEDVRLLREHCAPFVKVKASGGIRELAFALELVDAGAERLGASAGVALVNALTAE